MLRQVGLTKEDLAAVVARERAELARRVALYGGVSRARPPAPGVPGGTGDLAGRLVIVVDDGLATGVTARAALRAVRARGAARTVLAVPGRGGRRGQCHRKGNRRGGDPRHPSPVP